MPRFKTTDEKIAYLRKVLVETHGRDGDKHACLSCPAGSLRPSSPVPDVSDIAAIVQNIRSDREAKQRFENRYETPVLNALVAIGLDPDLAKRLMFRIRDCISGSEFVELVKRQLAAA